MKGVVDLFVSKDKIAVFWFLVACLSVVGSGWYLRKTIADVRAEPHFVIMDGAGVYYLAPTADFEDAVELHAAQTRLAMESLLNRGPNGPDSPNRIKKIFTDTAIEYIENEYQKEAKTFRDQKIHQKVEVGSTEVLKTVGEGAITSAEGQVIRVGVFDGKAFNEVYDVSARFAWALNRDMRFNGRYPTVCTQMKYELRKR
ncbi:MAG: hypothetical protein H7A53_12250 [Akkermansiaceae bacterium]|nr:hypothetical protein [Akkermansiaceae bacterium]MCP5551652.1 hypothetical protein [Akkermansiaceae bacterium]